MSFNSFEEFLLMGGHGLYVWLCYSAGLLCFIAAMVSPVIRKRAIYKELRQAQRRERAQQQTNEQQVH